MKIGIITFQSSHNCGSMLQAYALQQTLIDMGFENEIINFSNKGSRRLYNLLPPIHIKGHIAGYLVKRWFKTLPFITILRRQKKFYADFLEKHLNLTDNEYFSNEELCRANFDYTHYITGSDQVWNISCYDADDAYFLNFVKQGTKIAYAVSLGSNVIKEKTNDIKKYQTYISQFKAISVREYNAIKQIEELGGENIPILVDPTLLLTQEEWCKKFNLEERIIKEEYIFYYAFSYSSEVNKTVREISKRYNLPVYIIDARSWGPGEKSKDGLKLCEQSGPIAFLNLMKYAKLSLTTSFHGTVFSVIFRKHFWFINSSMHSEQDDRASTLTELLGMENRLIYGDKLLKQDIFTDVDYSDTTRRIESLKEKSTNFLYYSLQ